MRAGAASRAGRWAWLSVAPLVGIGLTGCAGVGDREQPPAADDPPGFSGPWADEFSAAYRNSTSERERRVLLDEVITDDEVRGLTMSGDLCGLREEVDQVYGRGTVDEGECGSSEIVSLYWSVRRNPENRDWGEIFVECLVRGGLVEPGFTVEEYEQLMTAVPWSDEWAEVAFSEEYNGCIEDPLGAGG